MIKSNSSLSAFCSRYHQKTKELISDCDIHIPVGQQEKKLNLSRIY